MESSIDVIRAEIQNAEPILKILDARLEAIEFDPLVASSVAAASAQVYKTIEDLLSPFKTNPILGPLAADLKTQYMDGIQSQVFDAKVRAIKHNARCYKAV